MKRSIKLSISLLLLVSAMNLAACGGRISGVAAKASVAPSANPQDFYQQPVDELLSPASVPAPVPSAVPNVQSGSFNVDQATLHDWQAKGVAVAGGTIYVSVSDTSGLFKKGSVIKMSSSDGKTWKDLGSTLLGSRHPMDSTVQGLAISGSTIIAVDSASKSYVIDAAKTGVKVVEGSGGVDVAIGAGSVFIANGTVNRSDMSASAGSPIMGLNATGGVGTDSQGNIYAVSGTTIKKADVSGQVQDVVTTDITSAIDVAVDSRNGDLYVLESTMIKRFNSMGQMLSQFANGATKAASIAVDEAGAVYVADTGTSNKDSKIIKFAASADAMVNTSSNSGYSSYSSNTTSGYNDYAAYSTTREAQTAAAKRR
ncbi:MAG: hypothetical protein ACK4IX_07490 [Candidatus Sericytochromatia bacterium]